jgi:hypothetical protein
VKNPKNNRGTARQFLILFLMWLMIFPVIVDAAPEELRYQAQLTPMSREAARSSYGLLELSDEIIGQTRENMPDLRLYNGDQEIPFALVPGTSTYNKKLLQVEMFNKGRNSVGDQFFEVKIPETQWVDGFVLLTPDKDFIRKVKVEGSTDQKEWLIIQPESTLFDLTKEQKSRNTEVNFTKTNLPFLRISISNEGKAPLQLEGVKLRLIDPKENVGERKERSFEQRISVDQKGIQEIFFELKFPNLPVEELEVIIGDKNFSRKVELYGSQTGERWDLLTQGEFYNFELDKASAQNTRLNFKGESQFYKLKVFNQDNRPLEIRELKLKGTNPSLAFLQSGEGNYIVRWGNSQMRAPQYDLDKLLPNLDYSMMSHYTLSQGEENPNYKFTDRRPWTERHSWLLNAVLVFAVIALLGIIIKSVKKVNA